MKIFGIVNVTPDSFSDGGRFARCEAAIDHGLRLVEEGADVLDIGGESTRPGAVPVSVEEELDRVLPVIEGLSSRSDARISIDTRKPEVARAAVEAGASIWNDVTALRFSQESVGAAADLGCDLVLMHMQGEPGTMQQEPRYADVVSEVQSFLKERIETCETAGISRGKIILDPGIGFGKALEHNLALLQNLESFRQLGCDLMMGASRKRFIAALDRQGDADARVGGSIAAALRAQAAGWHWVRVHDVEATRQALAVARAIAAT
ncbi:dihydropteroate synthase [Parvularcula sp. ZS-1/3]|uniref:Dihydropteroate synthase n=1 Tax=Parvularcula mediterranea TaxID=2732508 RepID=A0A7Y3RPH9_9PROT|nr:dihydropteroate synthase [Parvularcula mediterranea]NNU17336.1 dihydropteroate synthase [Parvularcula mediterranea]